jgi:hypothetical protein
MTGQERISHRLGGKGRDGGSVGRGRLAAGREKGGGVSPYVSAEAQQRRLGAWALAHVRAGGVRTGKDQS